MDKSLIWLLVPGLLAIYAFVHISARHKHLSYDMNEYFLAGKKLSTVRFALATSTVSLLGFMVLPHMGLFHRSGFSYGFLALGTIVMALTSALFARRVWNLATLFNPLTPAQLLGDYYRSNGLPRIATLIAVLIACCLTILALRLSLDLLQGLLGSLERGSVPVAHSKISHTIIFTLSALLFILAAYGGMGAILSIATYAGLAIFMALTAALFVAVAALGDWSGFLDRFGQLQQNQLFVPYLTTGDFFTPVSSAAPLHAPWPGLMVASSLLAFIGLALSPAALMSGFTARKGQSLATQQFFITALSTGILLLTAAIIIAFVPYLTLAPNTLANQNSSIIAGLEPQLIIRMLRMSPAGTPLITSLIALALLAGLLVSAATALLTAGGMVAAEWMKQNAKPTGKNLHHKVLTRMTIGILLFICLVLALQKPGDPHPLFLLAGAFGLQLLPTLLGLCYFKRLSGPAIQDGALAGLLAVFATSAIPQDIAASLGLALPFAAWPLSMHPALWGLLINLIALFVGSLIDRSSRNSEKSKKTLAHQKSWHVLPNGQPIMAPNAGKWRFIALVLLVLFTGAVAVPLTSLSLSGLPDLSLWDWQFVTWFIGLALVYVVAYRLQPNFDPEQALEGASNPLNRRFRVKAKIRKVEIVTPNSDPDRNDENIASGYDNLASDG